MRADFANLNGLLASDPDLRAALLAAGVGVFGISNSSVTDRNFAAVTNSYADLLAMVENFNNSLPFTSSPFKPAAIPLVNWPAAMNLTALDVVVPIRFNATFNANGLIQVPITALMQTVRFGNNTVMGDCQVDVYALSFDGQVMGGFTRSVVNTALGGANSSTEFGVIMGQRAADGSMQTTNSLNLSGIQSACYLKPIELGVVTTNGPAVLTNVVNFTTVPGAFPGVIFKPAQLAVVFRSLGSVTADVTVSPLYATPDNDKTLINLLLEKLAGKKNR